MKKLMFAILALGFAAAASAECHQEAYVLNGRVYYRLVCTAPPPPVYVQPGYTVVCRDGTISSAGGIQGACSYHGGVAH